DKGVKIVIIVAQGFTDGDHQGKLMQEEILDIAAKNGIRIIGPNTLGIVNNFDRFCTSFMRFINPIAPTGVLCQSGVFVVGAARISNGIGILIDTGNTSDLEFADLIGHLARDSRLKVVNLHMEGLKNGPKFMKAARDAAALKPVVVFKTGSSPVGAVAASSHTGLITGEDMVFDTAFKQCGLIRAGDIEEMFDLNKTFTTFNGISGKRVGVVSISGGAGINAVDAFSRYGLEAAPLSKPTMDLLGEMNPDWFHPCNPVDVWPASMLHGYHHVYRRVLEALMEDPLVDSILCITSSFLAEDEDFLDISALIREVAGKYPDKPVVAWTYGGRFNDYAMKLEMEKNVVAYPTVERAARALAALYKYHHEIKGKANHTMSLPANPGQEQAGKILAGKTSGSLDQADAFKILECCGIPAARWERAENTEEAVQAAGKIGYPVSIKVLSPDIIHKSDVGGVRLNIGDSQKLREACAEMFREINDKRPGAKVAGLIVQEYVSGGTELLLGCKRDPQFGPVLALGAGGVFTEIYKDVALGIPPLSRDEITKMIKETKVSRILAGVRGMPPLNMDALINCIMSFSQLVLANPSIMEIEINPLMAQENRVVALDARIIL
ncbi:MAG: acetate--CoA ligase family protein, partial [Firmicutes bacterium]|nr:acetate--CoA ligase family protein [Bacillota bacterium]